MLPMRAGHPGTASYATRTRNAVVALSFLSVLALLGVATFIIWLGVTKADEDDILPAPLPVVQSWVEYPGNPIYNPYPAPFIPTRAEDYYPWVVFDLYGFDNGRSGLRSPTYRMWHQNPTNLAMSTSLDGIHWQLVGELQGIGASQGYHAIVLYSADRFARSTAYYYKLYYWTGDSATFASALYAESVDGFTFVNLRTLVQDPSALLLTGVVNTLLYRFFGFGSVYYNAASRNVSGQPWTFPFVTLYDVGQTDSPAPGTAQGTSSEGIAMATSLDGITWSLYGQDPVLIPAGNSEWPFFDQSICARGTAFQDNTGLWNLYYTGSNRHFVDGTYFAHAIGRATSRNGVSWSRDPYSPIFSYRDPTLWRNDRTWASYVQCGLWETQRTYSCKMWYSGGTFLSGSSGPALTGTNQAIGYATYVPQVTPT